MNVLKEYHAQDKWRDWENMIRQLPIESNQTILDLGCGPGLLSSRLASLCEHVIGIDREPTFLDAARQQSPTNCEFINADLANLDASNLPQVNGLWSSFTAAYFPMFTPLLERWTSYIAPGGWLAIVEIDDLFTGHHPLPEHTQDAFREFMEHARLNNHYDFCMGGRLSENCRTVGLTILSEHSWKDRELAFDGKASTEILDAWAKRFKRMHGMKNFFGAKRFHQVTEEFLHTISSSEHYSTSSVKMVIARRPA